MTTQTERATERSLVLVKPDGYARGLTGEVLRRIEAKGYGLVALAVTTPTRTRTDLRDRGWTTPEHPIADSGPCKGHRCDDCPHCRGGTCLHASAS